MPTGFSRNTPNVRRWIEIAWDAQLEINHIQWMLRWAESDKYDNEWVMDAQTQVYFKLKERIKQGNLNEEMAEEFLSWIRFWITDIPDRLLLATKEFYPEHPKLQTQKYRKRLFDLEEIIRNTE